MSEIRMPKLSPTMESGTIAHWHKKEGDRIESGDLLLEIATDKATVEHTALDEGFLRKILALEGDEVKVGMPIALFTEAEEELLEEVSKEAPIEKKEAPIKKIEPIPSVAPKVESRLRASPLAKKIAMEKGLDLKNIQGTGPGGRILRRDLPEKGAHSLQRKEEPLSQVRRIIADRLQKAKRDIPHFYLTREIQVDRLLALREELSESGHSLTINDLLVKAVALALKAHPDVNVGYNEETKSIIHFGSIDICVAVSAKGGLITPFCTNCDQKPLLVFAKEMRALIEKARLGKLQLHEFQGGSFTVSNLGMYGISHFEAVINPPQGAILAVGAIAEKPVVVKGQILTAKILAVTLSVDHRVIDGSAGADFLRSLASICEKPSQLLL